MGNVVVLDRVDGLDWILVDLRDIWGLGGLQRRDIAEKRDL